VTAIRDEAADTDGRETSRARGPLARLDARLLAPGSAHRLACVRTVLAIALAVRIGIGAWTDLAGRPDAVFAPVLIVSWLPGVPPARVLVAVQVVGMVAALLAATRTRPRATFAIAWMALLFLGALHGSAGKIMHNEVLLLLACALCSWPRPARASATGGPPSRTGGSHARRWRSSGASTSSPGCRR